MITIIDYDAGNIGSVVNICAKAGGKARISADPAEIAAAEKLILPGVGHFGRSRDRLAAMGIDKALEIAVRERRVPLLGICLGMQLLTRSSEEGDAEGFGWIDAHTVRFSFPPETQRKVPHMGWSHITPTRPDPLLAGLDEEARFYFVHSYYVTADDPAHVLARTDYGGEFVSAVQHDNVWGMQFHPEKSHKFGLTVVRKLRLASIGRCPDGRRMNARAIPVLLLRGQGLVKTVRFKDAKYIGDPINAVRLFNDLEVDELIFLDIDASREGREPPFERIRELASECFMPICYGGGITRFEQAQQLYKSGVEKLALTTALTEHPALIRQIADTFGEQAVVVGIDVKRDWRGRSRAVVRGGTTKTGLDPVDAARQAAALGAGEIMIQSIDRDGTYQGYDIELVRAVAAAVDVPVIAAGGASGLPDLRKAIDAGASAAAAGSIFVYKGTQRAVLVNYPTWNEWRTLLEAPAAV